MADKMYVSLSFMAVTEDEKHRLVEFADQLNTTFSIYIEDGLDVESTEPTFEEELEDLINKHGLDAANLETMIRTRNRILKQQKRES